MDLIYHRAKFAGLRTSHVARRQGRKSSTFLSVTLLNDKVCERDFFINGLEFGNDLAIVKLGDFCRCSPAFNCLYYAGRRHHTMVW